MSVIEKAKEELRRAEERLQSKKLALLKAEKQERQKLTKRLIAASKGLDGFLSLDDEALKGALKEINERAFDPQEIEQWSQRK